ncbi:MAG: mandelate racemase/muconate lactonizing enzyme family protein [Haloferacaceae archaeon]
MRVTGVESIPMETAIDTVTRKGGSSAQTITVNPVMARVETDAGITGVGESFVFDPEGSEARMVAAGIDALADRIVGEDPRDVVARWHEMYTDAKRSTAYRSLSAIDEALWDIKGKDADKPLYRLLGGDAGEVEAYATFPHFKEAERLVEDSEWLADRGFRLMKIVATGDLEHDRHRVRTVAEGSPDGFGLAIDANTSYGFADALRIAETGAEHDLAWFEEPISHLDVQGQARLNERTAVPIAAYQTHRPHYPAVEHLRADALEIYQPTLDLVGGVTAADNVATLVEGFDKRFVPHTFGPGVNYAASLHVCAATPACDLIEFAVFDDTLDDPGRFIASPYLENQGEIRMDEDGTIRPPEGPGIGVEVDEDALEAYRID